MHAGWETQKAENLAPLVAQHHPRRHTASDNSSDDLKASPVDGYLQYSAHKFATCNVKKMLYKHYKVRLPSLVISTKSRPPTTTCDSTISLGRQNLAS